MMGGLGRGDGGGVCGVSCRVNYLQLHISPPLSFFSFLSLSFSLFFFEARGGGGPPAPPGSAPGLPHWLFCCPNCILCHFAIEFTMCQWISQSRVIACYYINWRLTSFPILFIDLLENTVEFTFTIVNILHYVATKGKENIRNNI